MNSKRRALIANAEMEKNSANQPAAGKKWNILFLYADQHRGMDMGCAGNRQVMTPTFDRLAREGTFFANGIANCPVCTPSRAILLTGKYSLTNRAVVNDLPLPAGQDSLASLLRALGYGAGYIGKWHLDGIPRSKFTPPGPRRQGFDDYWAAYNCTHAYFDPKYYLDAPELIRRQGYEPDIQTDLAIDFIKKYKDEPFFLMLSWGPPHEPYELVPESYRSMYDPREIQLPRNAINAPPRTVADYYAAITALDHNAGRLLQTLEELGLRENTLIVYTADHGDMLWSHDRVKKQQPWEESIYVPLILNAPGLIPAGVRCDALVGTADMAPTLLGLLGVAAPSAMQGWDLSQRILTGAGKEHDSVPIMDIVPSDQANIWHGREWRGVRTKRYTYARWIDLGWVLYDNQEDPNQMINRIKDPDFAAIRQELENELQQWLDALGDRFLTAQEQLEAMGLSLLFQERQEHFHSGKNW